VRRAGRRHGEHRPHRRDHREQLDRRTANTDPTDATTESSSTAAPQTTDTLAPESSSEDGDPSTGAVDSSSSEDDGGHGSICNNGVIEGNEECDCGGFTCSADGLGDMQCSDLEDPLAPGPLTGGTLQCNPASCRFDISMCSWCGDEIIGEHEDCEPDSPISVDCGELGLGSAGTVTCGTKCTYDTSTCTFCGHRFEFHGGGGCPYGFGVNKLDPSAGPASWQCGDPNNYELGPGNDTPGMFATNLVGPYNANEASALVSPPIDVSSCSETGLQLELVHWHDFEGGPENADGGLVQVSVDGTTWTTVAPISGALYDPNPLKGAFPPIDGGVGFSGALDEEAWVSSVFDLSEWIGASALRVRLVFGSDAATQTGGWYIDTLEIRGVAR
jgi:hypothetical protein